jgi:general secretion pathway protein E
MSSASQKRNLELIRTAIKKPYGLILISGPTGSGKSTTLYASSTRSIAKSKTYSRLKTRSSIRSPASRSRRCGPKSATPLQRVAHDAPPGPKHHHGRRDPRQRDRQPGGAGGAHRPLGALDHPHQQRIGIVPRLLDMGVEPYLIPPVLILGHGTAPG